MSSIDNVNRVNPITPVVYNKDKPREEPKDRQERYHEYIARRYREEAERDRQLEEAKNADIHAKRYQDKNAEHTCNIAEYILRKRQL